MGSNNFEGGQNLLPEFSESRSNFIEADSVIIICDGREPLKIRDGSV